MPISNMNFGFVIYFIVHILCVLVVLAAANADRDWSQIRYREINPITRKINTWAESRVVGGDEVVPNSRPFQAALFVSAAEGVYFCGGSLIDNKHILTAAHCLDVPGFTQVEVVLGAHKIREEESTQLRLVSTNVKIHAFWSSLFLVNDIAVIVLPEPVVTNEHIQIVSLPKYSDVANDFSGVEAIISGWGKDSDEATAISLVLRQVTTSVITKIKCNEAYLGIIGEGHICSEGKLSGGELVGACSGDSGGPLTIARDVTTQVGVVSFGISFGCELGWPSVYTRTTNYLGWIEANSDAQIPE